MKKYFFILSACALFFSCRRNGEEPAPALNWDLFSSAAARPIAVTTFQRMEGVYTIEQGTDDFGTITPLKWSYTVNGTDTVHHLSFFMGQDAAYFVCEGRRLDSTILLNGYWRRMVSSETGKVWLTITKEDGGKGLLSTNPPFERNIVVTGFYGNGAAKPDLPIRMRYTIPLFRAIPFEIIAHRGGGRTADRLPASENSVEMIKLASRFGSTGVEIDVRLTKDGIPILFHDATLNERVVQKSGLLGPIENYTFDQLSAVVRLTNGERIPTLRQALQTIVFNTPLEFVWLDTKYIGSLQVIRDLQTEFLQKAATINRKLEIVIGIPDEEVLDRFKQLPNFQNIPSLVEYSPEEARAVNARIWGPQWTLGLQNEEVISQQAQGRRVFTWTMDIGENIQRYMREGRFNGILTNYPSIVAFYYYAKQ